MAHFILRRFTAIWNGIVLIATVALLIILTACGGGGSEETTATDILVQCQAGINCKG